MAHVFLEAWAMAVPLVLTPVPNSSRRTGGGLGRGGQGRLSPGAAQDQSSETRTPALETWVNLLTVINHTAIFALQELLSPNLGLG